MRRARTDRETSMIVGAYRVISRQGVHRTTLQDIAYEAGISKGLLVYYFGSKDAVLIATMRWALERTSERIHTRLSETDGDLYQVISALVAAVFVGPKQNREFYLLYLDLLENSARAPSFGDLAALTRRVVNGLYREILRNADCGDAFSPDDLDVAAVQMRAYIDGIFVTWLQDPDWQTSHDHYRRMCHTGLLKLLEGA